MNDDQKKEMLDRVRTLTAAITEDMEHAIDALDNTRPVEITVGIFAGQVAAGVAGLAMGLKQLADLMDEEKKDD